MKIFLFFQGRGFPPSVEGNLGVFPLSGGSSPGAASASKESSPQSQRATPVAGNSMVHANVSSPPSVTASAHASASSAMPPVSTTLNQTSSSGQYNPLNHAQMPSSSTGPPKQQQHPSSTPNQSMQSSSSPSSHRPANGNNSPHAPAYPAAQNLVNSAATTSTQHPSPNTAIPSPTLVGGGSFAQSSSTIKFHNNATDQHQQLPRSSQGLPSSSIDVNMKGVATPSTGDTSPELSTPGTTKLQQQQQQQHPKAPSNTSYESGKPSKLSSQPDTTLERDSVKRPTTTSTISPSKSASSAQPAMTKDSEKPPPTPSTSRFKVTGVPESDLPAAAAASAFKPAATHPQTTSSVHAANVVTAVASQRDDAEGLSRRPTTIPLDTGGNNNNNAAASRRGSLDPPSVSEHLSANGSATRKVSDQPQQQIVDAANGKNDPDTDVSEVDVIHDLKEELRSGGISPLSRQTSKKEDVALDHDSEGSGAEEG